MNKGSKNKQSIPGFKLTLGWTVFYLLMVVILPLSMLFVKTSTLTFDEFIQSAFSARVVASYKLTFFCSFVAATINLFAGLLVAWVLVRYDFPFKKMIDALIDLPFALPTAVAGITLTSLYAVNGILGSHLEPLGIKIAFTPLGIIAALSFISFPLAVRTIEPVLADMDHDMEEASVSLGAGRFKTFLYVILPNIRSSLVTGFTLSFARSLGEYGSVVFISGNMPFKTEITPLLIITKLEQYDYAGATAIACVSLVISLLLFGVINHFENQRIEN